MGAPDCVVCVWRVACGVCLCVCVCGATCAVVRVRVRVASDRGFHSADGARDVGERHSPGQQYPQVGRQRDLRRHGQVLPRPRETRIASNKQTWFNDIELWACSLFVCVPGATREQAFKVGREIAEAVTKANPWHAPPPAAC